MKRFSFILIIIFSLMIVNNASAGTILSSKGIGAPFLFPNTRALGMGYISIAQFDPLTISRTNPAGLYANLNTRLSVQFFSEINHYKDPFASAKSNYANFDGFSFVLPVGSGLGFGTSLRPITRQDYRLTYQDSLMGETYTKSIKGSGGINAFELSAYWGPTRRFALGLTGRFIFGRMKEDWRVQYDNTSFAVSYDRFETKNNGFGLTAGIIANPVDAIIIGAIYTPKVTLNSEINTYYSSFSAISDTTITHDDGDLTLPQAWGIGVTYKYKALWQLGVEYATNQWDQLTLNTLTANDLGVDNTQRVSVGFEIRPRREMNAPFFSRIAYRLGFSHQPYFAKDAQGNQFTEQWLTAGLGLPTILNATHIDLSFGYGMRGSLDENRLQERLFRIGVSITRGERWFMRRY